MFPRPGAIQSRSFFRWPRPQRDLDRVVQSGQPDEGVASQALTGRRAAARSLSRAQQIVDGIVPRLQPISRQTPLRPAVKVIRRRSRSALWIATGGEVSYARKSHLHVGRAAAARMRDGAQITERSRRRQRAGCRGAERGRARK
ncbi:hypothetical protein PUN28_014924 [Cardiocondyla obscurior]|uniref:Uncharacterized protein n=1 Tax=Cardiocondyla obscurior TaxID=286306 RepID=A0AAW2EXD1_9HYME